MTGLFTPPSDIAAVTKALSASVNDLSAAVEVMDNKLPTEAEIKRGTINFAVDTGAADAYVVDLPYVPSGYVDGLEINFRPTNTNTGASTVNVNSLGVKSLKRADGSALSAGDITVGAPVLARYSTATGYFHMNGNSAVDATAAAASAAAASGSASSASGSAGTATTQASNAAASAVLAASIASGLIGTSTSSLLIEVASKTFATQAGKLFASGQFITASSAADSANFMFGQVTSYSGTTLIVNVLVVGGSGTLADWNLSVSGARGAQGIQGIQGDPGASGSLTKVEESGATRTATAGNDYWLTGPACAVTVNATPVDSEEFCVTPANGLTTNTILFGAATAQGYYQSTTGTVTMNPAFPMTWKWSSTLSKWVLK